MYLLAPFILQSFKKKNLRIDSELWGYALFSGQNKIAHLSWTKIFWFCTIVITFIYLLALFIAQNFYSGSRIMTVHHFWTQIGSFTTSQFFFENYYYHSHLPISPSHCAKVRNVQFLGPKWPISPNNNFFRKPFHEPCFFYSCLSICQKSKLDINLLVKYWWLNNTEISLAERHFCF